jgi:hypothetical protein
MENKGIFNRIGNYLSYLGKRFDDFLDRRPRLKKAYGGNFNELSKSAKCA